MNFVFDHLIIELINEFYNKLILLLHTIGMDWSNNFLDILCVCTRFCNNTEKLF